MENDDTRARQMRCLAATRRARGFKTQKRNVTLKRAARNRNEVLSFPPSDTGLFYTALLFFP